MYFFYIESWVCMFVVFYFYLDIHVELLRLNEGLEIQNVRKKLMKKGPITLPLLYPTSSIIFKAPFSWQLVKRDIVNKFWRLEVNLLMRFYLLSRGM